MNRGYWIALALAGCLATVSHSLAQAPASADGAQSGQNKPAVPQTVPPPQAVPQSGSNPFPEDTSNVPVMPAKGSAPLPDSGSESLGVPLGGDNIDPVRSPDDPPPAESSGDGLESSSLAGLDRVMPPPDDDSSDKPDKKDGKRKLAVKEPTHQEAASEDINVGGYYLEKKNWKAALSRFESAMILDSENPDVYWGLAEADRHLGSFVEARGYYQKVVDYDPDSKHGKEARKVLKDPEIANAKNTEPGQPTTGTPK
jgi:hypothetical protein